MTIELNKAYKYFGHAAQEVTLYNEAGHKYTFAFPGFEQPALGVAGVLIEYETTNPDGFSKYRNDYKERWSENKTNWISIKERLPGLETPVLFITDRSGQWYCGWKEDDCPTCRNRAKDKKGCGENFSKGMVYIAELVSMGGEHDGVVIFDHTVIRSLPVSYVSHWMPLPEEP